jgi:phospholipase C
MTLYHSSLFDLVQMNHLYDLTAVASQSVDEMK